MSIGVLLRGFIGDMMDFGDVILYTLFPSFMTIQACSQVVSFVETLPTDVRNRLGSARPPAYELLIGVDRVVTCDSKGDAQGQDSPLRHKNRRIAIVLS